MRSRYRSSPRRIGVRADPTDNRPPLARAVAPHGKVYAVDVDAGEIRWHYQCTPHDVWDYDSIAECILFESDGRKLLGHFDKNGYFFVLDRTDGALVNITPFVDRIDWGNITRDGKVTAARFPDKEGEPVHFYPGPAGAKEWVHAAYSPRTELFYVPVQDVGATGP